MKNIIYYPAIFTKEKKGYSVLFLDFDGNLFTCGDDLNDAYYMAQDVLWGYVDDGLELPKPTFNYMKTKIDDNSFITLVQLDIKRHAKIVSNQIVNTMVTMPEWLKEYALESNINFSQLLQKAIKEELDLE